MADWRAGDHIGAGFRAPDAGSWRLSPLSKPLNTRNNHLKVMNVLLAPFELFVRSLNLIPGVTASVQTEYVEVEDRTDAGGRRVLLVRNDHDPAAVRRAVETARERNGGPAPLVRFDCTPEADAATVVTDDPDARVELGHYAVTVEAEGVAREFDLPFDPSAADRHVSNGVLTVELE
jgi:hypothetical protein